MPSEVERIALQFDGVQFAKATGKANPITGQHVELIIQTNNNENFIISEFKNFMACNLPNHMNPRRIKIDRVEIGHRYKKL